MSISAVGKQVRVELLHRFQCTQNKMTMITLP